MLDNPAKSLSVQVNGTHMEVPSGTTVAGLLERLEIEPLLVAVEQNLEIVPKTQFPVRKISDGDRLEIVHFVGGG